MHACVALAILQEIKKDELFEDSGVKALVDAIEEGLRKVSKKLKFNHLKLNNLKFNNLNFTVQSL